jgi:pimeloyl-ACP methyl ester carboxylesterase
VEVPEPRYAKTADGTHIAYSVMGGGPIDLVYAFGYLSNIDADGEVPFHAAFRRKLSSVARLILFDRRGTGLSDRSGIEDANVLEAGMDDIRAVMDAVGSERALLFAVGDGGMVSVLFAASHPDRTLGLVLWNPEPGQSWSEDYPWGWTRERWEQRFEFVEATWGSLEYAEKGLRAVAPNVEFDRATIERVARMFRAVASPSSAAAIDRAISHADVRAVLPSIEVPTLVLHSAEEDSVAQGRYAASTIPGAERVEIPTKEWLPFWASADPVVEEIRGFVKKIRHEERVLDRVLATVMFTDIVGSTARAADPGRSGMEGAGRTPPRRDPGHASPLSRLRDRYGRRRLLRRVRRSGSRRSMRDGDRGRGEGARARGACRSTHRRGRNDQFEGRRHGGEHRGSGGRTGETKRDPCLEHRQGSRRWVGSHVRGRR